MRPAPFRRIAAFFIDYATIAAYIAVLTAAAFASGIATQTAAPENRFVAHAVAFLMVTAPIILGFALLEASPLEGTLGKRVMQLRVVRVDGRHASFAATLLRNGFKFLPWEIAHAGIWHMPGQPFVDAPGWPSMLAWVISLAVAGSYVITLFVGRTPYDRIAGVSVRRRASMG